MNLTIIFIYLQRSFKYTAWRPFCIEALTKVNMNNKNKNNNMYNDVKMTIIYKQRINKTITDFIVSMLNEAKQVDDFY